MNDLETEDSGLSLDDFEQVDRDLLIAADAAGLCYALVMVVKGIWRVFGVAEETDQLVEGDGCELYDIATILRRDDA